MCTNDIEHGFQLVGQEPRTLCPLKMLEAASYISLNSTVSSDDVVPILPPTIRRQNHSHCWLLAIVSDSLFFCIVSSMRAHLNLSFIDWGSVYD